MQQCCVHLTNVAVEEQCIPYGLLSYMPL